MLIVGNTIATLPLTNLRVIRGKSLLSLNVKVPRYATTTTPSTTSSSSVLYDDSDVWNPSTVHDDRRWKNTGVDDDQTGAWTTSSDGQDAEGRSCSLFVASNVKVNSTTIGLKEVHLRSLHG